METSPLFQKQVDPNRGIKDALGSLLAELESVDFAKRMQESSERANKSFKHCSEALEEMGKLDIDLDFLEQKESLN